MVVALIVCSITRYFPNSMVPSISIYGEPSVFLKSKETIGFVTIHSNSSQRIFNYVSCANWIPDKIFNMLQKKVSTAETRHGVAPVFPLLHFRTHCFFARPMCVAYYSTSASPDESETRGNAAGHSHLRFTASAQRIVHLDQWFRRRLLLERPSKRARSQNKGQICLYFRFSPPPFSSFFDRCL